MSRFLRLLLAGVCAASQLILRSTASALPAFETPGLSPLPGTEAARMLAIHQAEANRPVRPDLHSATASWLAADFQSLGTPPWQIDHQDITVDLTPGKSLLNIKIVIQIKANQKTDQLSFLMGGVSSVSWTYNGAALPVENQAVSGYSLLAVTLPQALTATNTGEFVVQASATLDCSPVGIGLHPCGLAGTYNYVTFFNYYLSSGDQQHSPFTSTLHVIAPAGQMAAAPGMPKGSEKLADGRNVWHFEQVERTDNAGFAIAQYVPMDAKLGTGAPLRIYATGQFTKYISNMRDLTIDVVKWYGDRFAPFPWPALNLIQVDNSFGGGYSPLSGIFMSRDEFAGEPKVGMWQSVVELAAHEIAHQWWGNFVEPMSSGDVSLSESMAEFSSCQYTETHLGNRSQVIRNNVSYMYQVPSKNDVALGAQSVHNSPYYVQIVYYKGAVVFDMLRQLVGDDIMAQGLTAYTKKFGRDYAKVDDLRVVMEQAYGKKLDWFWQQWFVKKNFIHAELAGRVVQEGGQLVLRLRIAQPADKLLRFVVPVTLDYRGGKSEVQKVEVPGTESVFVAQLPLTERPIRVRFDIQRTQLRQFSTGTPGDFNMSGLTDGADLVELALRHGRAIVVKGKNGQDHFFPDTSWNELYDLNPDGHVDDADIEALDGYVGTVGEEF